MKKVYEISLKFDRITDYPPLKYRISEYDQLAIMAMVKDYADTNKIPNDFIQDKGVIFIEGINEGVSEIDTTYDDPILLEPDFSILIRK